MGTIHRAVLAVACLALTGCAVAGGIDQERRFLAAGDRYDLDPGVRQAILEGHVLVGMSEEMVAASWGVPRRTWTIDDVVSVWEYGPQQTLGWTTQLSFAAGTLVSVEQDRPRGFSAAWNSSQGDHFHPSESLGHSGWAVPIP